MDGFAPDFEKEVKDSAKEADRKPVTAEDLEQIRAALLRGREEFGFGKNGKPTAYAKPSSMPVTETKSQDEQEAGEPIPYDEAAKDDLFKRLGDDKDLQQLIEMNSDPMRFPMLVHMVKKHAFSSGAYIFENDAAEQIAVEEMTRRLRSHYTQPTFTPAPKEPEAEPAKAEIPDDFADDAYKTLEKAGFAKSIQARTDAEIETAVTAWVTGILARNDYPVTDEGQIARIASDIISKFKENTAETPNLRNDDENGHDNSAMTEDNAPEAPRADTSLDKPTKVDDAPFNDTQIMSAFAATADSELQLADDNYFIPSRPKLREGNIEYSVFNDQEKILKHFGGVLMNERDMLDDERTIIGKTPDEARDVILEYMGAQGHSFRTGFLATKEADQILQVLHQSGYLKYDILNPDKLIEAADEIVLAEVGQRTGTDNRMELADDHSGSTDTSGSSDQANAPGYVPKDFNYLDPSAFRNVFGNSGNDEGDQKAIHPIATAADVRDPLMDYVMQRSQSANQQNTEQTDFPIDPAILKHFDDPEDFKERISTLMKDLNALANDDEITEARVFQVRAQLNLLRLKTGIAHGDAEQNASNDVFGRIDVFRDNLSHIFTTHFEQDGDGQPSFDNDNYADAYGKLAASLSRLKPSAEQEKKAAIDPAPAATDTRDYFDKLVIGSGIPGLAYRPSEQDIVATAVGQFAANMAVLNGKPHDAAHKAVTEMFKRTGFLSDTMNAQRMADAFFAELAKRDIAVIKNGIVEAGDNAVLDGPAPLGVFSLDFKGPSSSAGEIDTLADLDISAWAEDLSDEPAITVEVDRDKTPSPFTGEIDTLTEQDVSGWVKDFKGLDNSITDTSDDSTQITEADFNLAMLDEHPVMTAWKDIIKPAAPGVASMTARGVPNTPKMNMKGPLEADEHGYGPVPGDEADEHGYSEYASDDDDAEDKNDYGSGFTFGEDGYDPTTAAKPEADDYDDAGYNPDMLYGAEGPTEPEASDGDPKAGKDDETLTYPGMSKQQFRRTEMAVEAFDSIYGPPSDDKRSFEAFAGITRDYDVIRMGGEQNILRLQDRENSAIFIDLERDGNNVVARYNGPEDGYDIRVAMLSVIAIMESEDRMDHSVTFDFNSDNIERRALMQAAVAVVQNSGLYPHITCKFGKGALGEKDLGLLQKAAVQAEARLSYLDSIVKLYRNELKSDNDNPDGPDDGTTGGKSRKTDADADKKRREPKFKAG